MKKDIQFRSNLTAAFLAQSVSLIASLLMAMLVTRILSVADYGYWQLFLLQIAYVGLSHFGWVDGVYLRTLGKDYRKLDVALYGKQFWILVLWQGIAAGVLALISTGIFSQQRLFITYMTLLYMILSNLFYYFGYIFQATNRTKVYSQGIIFEKIVYIVLLVMLILRNCRDYRLYIMSYCAMRAIALLYYMIRGRAIVAAKWGRNKRVSDEIRENIKAGSNLLIGSLAGAFIIGSARMIVDWRWGIEKFSLFSFSITLTNFFMVFIGQISMVLLPAMKRTSRQEQKKSFQYMRRMLPLLMLGMMVFYTPCKEILSKWLPQYKESLHYMAIFLPICVFDGKMQLIHNMYLKILRKERMFLKINLWCVAAAFILSVASAIFFDSVELIMFIIVGVIMLRSLYAEYYLENIFGVTHSFRMFAEMFLAVIFVVTHLKLTSGAAFGVYGICYFVYLGSSFMSERRKIKR